MKTRKHRIVGLGAAAVMVPFVIMGFYLASTRGGNLHSAVEIDLFFLCISVGVGCICLWALPFKSITKIVMVLPYIAVVGGGTLFIGYWFLARFYGTGP